MEKPQPHDLFTKAVLKDEENLKAFLSEFLPKSLTKHLNLSKLTLVPEEQITLSHEKRLIPDICAEVPLKGSKRKVHIYMLIEHKSYPDKRAYLQILNYITSLCEKSFSENRDFPPVLPLIYYHGRKPWLYPVRFSEFLRVPEEIKDYFLDFYVELVDLLKLKDEELLKKVETYDILYTFMLLQKKLHAPLEELLEVVERFISLGTLLSERRGYFFWLYVKFIAHFKKIDEENVLHKIIERGGQEVLKELKLYPERKYEEGLEKGLQEGIQKGLEKGLLIEAQEMVIEVIELRLGGVPEEVERLIRSEKDRNRLRNLLRELVISKDPFETLRNFYPELEFP